MAKRIINLALPSLPLVGTELMEMSTGGILSIQVAVNEALTKLYYNTVEKAAATAIGISVAEYVDSDTGVLRTSGDMSIEGDLFVDGTTWVVNNQEVTTSDNIIVLNYGETGPGVTAGSAGIMIDRGSLTDYQFIFVESSDTFQIGELGNLQVVATREDSPIDNGYAIWNDSLSRFDTTTSISGSVVHNEVTGLQGGDSTAQEFYHLTQSIHDGLFSASPLIGIGSQFLTNIEVDYGNDQITMDLANQQFFNGVYDSGSDILNTYIGRTGASNAYIWIKDDQDDPEVSIYMFVEAQQRFQIQDNFMRIGTPSGTNIFMSETSPEFLFNLSNEQVFRTTYDVGNDIVNTYLGRIGASNAYILIADDQDDPDVGIRAIVENTQVLTLTSNTATLGGPNDTNIRLFGDVDTIDMHVGNNKIFNSVFDSGSDILVTNIGRTGVSNAYINILDDQDDPSVQINMYVENDRIVQIGNGSVVIRPVGVNEVQIGVGGLALKSGVSVNAILDEDGMGSDLNTALATQQSIKAYVDISTSLIADATANNMYYADDLGQIASTSLMTFRENINQWGIDFDGIFEVEREATLFSHPNLIASMRFTSQDWGQVSLGNLSLFDDTETFVLVNQVPSDVSQDNIEIASGGWKFKMNNNGLTIYENVSDPLFFMESHRLYLGNPVLTSFNVYLEDDAPNNIIANTIGIKAGNLGTTAEDHILLADSTSVVINGDVYCDDLYTSADTIHIGTGQITSAAGVIQIADLEVTNAVNLPEGSVEASDVDYAKVSGATYSTVQEAMDQLGSAGLISGGIISLDGTTSINVTLGTGMLRTSNDLHAPLVFINFPETLSIPIPGDDTKNIVVNYNGGTPIVEAIDPGTFNTNTYFILGQVGRAEDDLIISNLRQRISDFSARILARMYSTGSIARAGDTGLILGESADTNRYVTMTEGNVWALLDLESLSAINTGTGDDFTTIYRDSPSGYVETPGETQWDMLKYDDGSGTLQDLSNGRYGVRWFWLIPTDESLFMVYGTGNWKSLAEAEAEPVPTEIPSLLGTYGILLGRIIVLKNQNIAIEVSTSFDTTYDFSGVTDHGNLSNLGSPADDHTQYIHIDGRRSFTDEVGGIYPTADASLATKEYVDDQAPVVILVYGDSTAVNGDILIVDATSEITITLIASANAKITVKTIRDDVEIQGDSGTIDGNANVELYDQYDSMTFVCDGINWYII